jgi:GTP-binding protein HflX
MTVPTEGPRPRAVLAAVQPQGQTDAELDATLAELGRLVDTLGFEVVGRVTQKRNKHSGVALFGKGKLHELAAWTGGTGVVFRGPTEPTKGSRKGDLVEPDDDDDDDFDVEEPATDELEAPPGAGEPRATVVVVDHDLSPQQLRNLEKATGAEVLDRSGVIVEIFHRHASSREARLQVEIARLTYLAPRLRETGQSERQKGGIGQKGAGESSVELDRRKIRDRLAELREELAVIEGESKTRRQRRSDALRVAFVGYTNAGKSSWMRALTGSDVLVADKLFATLGTTVRQLWPETRPKILVSDTVGFIKNLPHDLVASFRSTLDEALEATLLIFVVDAADADFRGQLAVTREVLADIGAGDVPSLLLLNKIDKVDAETRADLRREFPDALQVSSRSADDVKHVRGAIIATFEREMEDAEIVVPYGKQGVVGEMHKVRVLAEDYADDGIHFTVRASRPAIERLRSLVE